MTESLPTFQQELDPTIIGLRNKKLEEILDPERCFPVVDVYPILGGTFADEDLANKYPHGTLLPLQKALDTGQAVTLILGYSNRNAADITLQPVDGLRLWQVVDTWVPGGEQLPEELSLRGLGFGKRLFLELFKHLPIGTELTHNELTTDGARMWSWLVEKGLAIRRADRKSGEPGEYVTQISSLLRENP